MSFWTRAMVAAPKAVKQPTVAMTMPAIGSSENTKFMRQIRKTPAVTMVAACISAETGVGPAMASGNQVYSGICALLPVAAMNSSSDTGSAIGSRLMAVSGLVAIISIEP